MAYNTSHVDGQSRRAGETDAGHDCNTTCSPVAVRRVPRDDVKGHSNSPYLWSPKSPYSPGSPIDHHWWLSETSEIGYFFAPPSATIHGKGVFTWSTSKYSENNLINASTVQCCLCPGVFPSRLTYHTRNMFMHRQSGSLGTLTRQYGLATCLNT